MVIEPCLRRVSRQCRPQAGAGATTTHLRTADLAARRVMGYPMQVHLGHILTAVALTVPRLGAWWLETACVNSRVSPFARLMADAAVP